MNTLPRPNKLLLNVGGPLVTLRGASYEWYRQLPRPPPSVLTTTSHYYQYKTSLYCLVETIQIRTRAEPDGTANTSRDDNRLSRRSTAPIPSIVYYYIFNEHNSSLIKNDTISTNYCIYI